MILALAEPPARLDTAIAETRFHLSEFLGGTREGTVEITMRTYINTITRALEDIRQGDDELHDPDPARYGAAQAFAARRREAGASGMLYRSVRDPGHE